MPATKTGLNILVVDDSRTDLAVMAAMLTEMGHEVRQSCSGEAALEMFRQHMPDMVLMDVAMHGMGGCDTVREMRRIARDDWIPIIFTTSPGQEDDIVRGIEAGGDDYLLKPVHYKMLHAKINALRRHLQLFRRIKSQEEMPIPVQPGSRHIEIHASNGIVERQPRERETKVEWQFGLTLTAPQLRQADIVPMLMHVVDQIEHEGVQGLSGKLFLVLSELFNNALDHGLLGLNSALKNDSSGMDHYFEERAARLHCLAQGEIKIKLVKISGGHGPCLKMSITDSGEGFDFLATQAALPGADVRRHGRGIALVESMSGQLYYSDNGRESHACIPLCGPEQCASCSPEAEAQSGKTPVSKAS